MRKPTEKQLRRLAVVAQPGTFVLAPRRKEWRPLLQRGLVTAKEWTNAGSPSHDERFLPPCSITPDGLRALADFKEAEGHWPGEAEWCGAESK